MKTFLASLVTFTLGVMATIYTQDYRDSTARADAERYIAALRARCKAPTPDWLASVVVDSRTGQPACLKIPPQPGATEIRRPIIVQTLNEEN